MIIIWRSYGIGLLLIAIFVFLTMHWLTDQVFGGGYYDFYVWPRILAHGVTGVLVWHFGQMLESRDETIQHDFFFIRVKYWAFIILAFAVLMLLH